MPRAAIALCLVFRRALGLTLYRALVSVAHTRTPVQQGSYNTHCTR